MPTPDGTPRHSDSAAAVFGRFLRFGLLAWGGPFAQIAMLRRELVDEERWVDGHRFNRLLAVYQALPGPEAHELAVHLGFSRRGRLGGLLAGLGFMLPGFLLMLAVSWLYFQVDLGQPGIAAALLGAQLAVIALVVRAVGHLGRRILVDRGLVAIAISACLATFAGIPFWITLPAGAAAHIAAGRTGRWWPYGLLVVVAGAALAWLAASGVPPSLGGTTASPTASPIDPSIPALFVSGLKAGLLTFGGAYTAIPFLRGDAVGSGWLTDAQFLDGIALGGVLPAPLIIFSTFVGYVAGGPLGAVAMTAGVFLPAFSFALLFGDRIEAVVDHAGLHRLLEGVAAAVVGVIAITALELALGVGLRLPSLGVGLAIFGAALATLVVARTRLAVPAVVGAAAVAGWLLLDLAPA